MLRVFINGDRPVFVVADRQSSSWPDSRFFSDWWCLQTKSFGMSIHIAKQKETCDVLIDWRQIEQMSVRSNLIVCVMGKTFVLDDQKRSTGKC
jgi:hypothetical protein